MKIFIKKYDIETLKNKIKNYSGETAFGGMSKRNVRRQKFPFVELDGYKISLNDVILQNVIQNNFKCPYCGVIISNFSLYKYIK